MFTFIFFIILHMSIYHLRLDNCADTLFMFWPFGGCIYISSVLDC